MKKEEFDYAYKEAKKRSKIQTNENNNLSSDILSQEEITDIKKNKINKTHSRKKASNIDIIVEEKTEEDRTIKKNGVTLTFIGSKILDSHLHYVLSREITYSEFLDGKSQIYVPDGYRLISLNRDDNLLNNNYAVFENIKPVKVKVYKTEEGKEVLPEFGEPII